MFKAAKELRRAERTHDKNFAFYTYDGVIGNARAANWEAYC